MSTINADFCRHSATVQIIADAIDTSIANSETVTITTRDADTCLSMQEDLFAECEDSAEADGVRQFWGEGQADVDEDNDELCKWRVHLEWTGDGPAPVTATEQADASVARAEDAVRDAAAAVRRLAGEG